MVRQLSDRYYTHVSRYTTSGFMRMKLAEALEHRGVAATSSRRTARHSMRRGHQMYALSQSGKRS